MSGTGTSIIVGDDGNVRCLYDEVLDLRTLGDVTIQRASHVEPDAQSRWRVDLAPVGGPVLGPFHRRSDALAAERAWLVRHLPALVMAGWTQSLWAIGQAADVPGECPT